MSIKSATATLLLALAAALPALAALPAGALATTGGAVAPSEAPPPPTLPAPQASKTRIHSSGIATWFGPGFYGKRTACGQTLTPATVGVANRTLPCGTLIKVTYAGRSVTVPVLDRGPYSGIGADWDLTGGAALALGVSETVRIGTRIVGAAPNSSALGAPLVAPTGLLAGGAEAG